MSLNQGWEEVVGWKLSRKQERSDHGKVTAERHLLLRQRDEDHFQKKREEVQQFRDFAKTGKK